METSEYKKEYDRVRNLKSSSKKSDHDIRREVFVNLEVRNFRKNPLFEDNEAQKIAEEKYRSYLDITDLESVSELDTLKSLIFNEILESKIQQEINKAVFVDGKAPMDRITKQLTDIQNQKISLRQKLGIDLDDDEDSDLTKLQQLEKRFQKHIEENRAEFSWEYAYKCEKCKHRGVDIVLARKRVKDFSLLKHPWHAGRYLFNYEILKDVKDKKLSKQDAWRYLCCASTGGNYEGTFSEEYVTSYIDYCLDNWAKIVSHFNFD